MDAPGRREEKKRAVRATIARAATELFADRGYDNTTVDMIVERAGVSAPTFFRYFGSKEEVVAPGAVWRLPMLRDAILDQPPNVSSFVAARNAVLEAIDCDLDTERLRLQTRAIATNATLSGRAQKARSAWERTIAEALDQRLGPKAAREDHRLVAAIVMTIVYLGTDRWSKAGSADYIGELRASFDSFSVSFGAGLGTEPDS